MITKNHFKYYCSDQILQWFSSFDARRYKICNRIARRHVELCRNILKGHIWRDAEVENNGAYITGVLFKGLIEFIQLADLTRDQKWHLNNKRTEKVWTLMWNCIDRFDFSSSTLNYEGFTRIRNKLEELRKIFIDYFGPGFYSSPEILIRNESCGICKKDIRACPHMPGRLYNGTICHSIPQHIELKSVSLVTLPEDPRCRIWPWNMNTDKSFHVVVMTLFHIDDWLTDVK